MISGFMHPGSGIGNMLHRYVAVRVLALDKGYDFSMIGSRHFKGSSFMNLDMGKSCNLGYTVQHHSGKIVTKASVWEEKTQYYNPEFNFIQDGSILDGEFQDERYFEHRLEEIDGWLKVEPVDIPDDLCIINFRGGEYKLFPDLFLTQEYWREGIIRMMIINPDMRFEVHTDDPDTAGEFFHSFPIVHDIGLNWRSVRYAKYAIVANTSFCILPRLLQHHTNKEAVTIAPRYWARANTKEWSMPQNFYKSFLYV